MWVTRRERRENDKQRTEGASGEERKEGGGEGGRQRGRGWERGRHEVVRERLEEEGRRKPGRTEGREEPCPPLLCSLLSLSVKGCQALGSHNSAVGLSPPTTTRWPGVRGGSERLALLRYSPLEPSSTWKVLSNQNGLSGVAEILSVLPARGPSLPPR